MEPFTATDLTKKKKKITCYICLNCGLVPFSGIPHFTTSDVNMEAEIKSIIDRKSSLGKSRCLFLDYGAVIWCQVFISCFSYLGNSSTCDWISCYCFLLLDNELGKMVHPLAAMIFFKIFQSSFAEMPDVLVIVSLHYIYIFGFKTSEKAQSCFKKVD